MPLTTYAELQQTINDYLEQDDVTGKVADFIRLAEVRMEREMSVQGMHKTKTGSLDTGTVALPDDYIEAISWRLTSSYPAIVGQYVHPNKFFGMRASSIDSTPRAYTIVGSNSLWAPDPTGVDAGTYTYALEYLARIPPLTDNNTTNWLLDQAPDCYLYASLLEAMPFVIDDERLGTWVKMYERAIASLISVDYRKRNRPGGVMRPASTPADGKFWARY